MKRDVAIVGAGYVGVPLALTFADKGFRVLGFDVDAEKVAALNRGECYIRHVDSVRVRQAANGMFIRHSAVWISRLSQRRPRTSIGSTCSI